MAVKRWTNLRPQYVDTVAVGNPPLNGGRLFFYAAGTSTKQNTYTDSTGVTPNTNPVVLNSAGEPSTEIWLTVGSTYKVGLAVAGVDDPPASFLWTEDNISPINDVTTIQPAQWQTFAGVPTFVSTTSFTVLGDQRQIFDQGRRVQTTNTGGTVYSSVSAASTYDGTRTTVTLTNDSGALDAGLSAVFYGILSAVNSSIPPHASNIFAVQDNVDNTKRAKFSVSGVASGATRLIDLSVIGNVPLFNGTIVASVVGNALTLALKTVAGADPSPSDPVFVAFRNAVIATGDVAVRAITAASSIVVSSGATLGALNSTPFRVWLVGFDDAGTFRLGVMNCVSGTNIYPLAGFGIASSTAPPANSAQVFYTGTAIAAKAYTVLGYGSYEAGLAAAGTWISTPTRLQIFTPWTPLPGAVVQIARNSTGAFATGATIIPEDDTIPQITEGNEYMTQAIIPASAANLLRISFHGVFANTAAVQDHITALFQDAAVNALAAVDETTNVANAIIKSAITHLMLAGATVSTTFRVRHGGSSAGTTTFNGIGGARFLGGVFNSYLSVEELMT